VKACLAIFTNCRIERLLERLKLHNENATCIPFRRPGYW